MSPVPGFESLGVGQYWYRPTQIGSAPPHLIILGGWLFAAPKHLLKYVNHYRLKYPCAHILLLENSIAKLVWTSDKAQWLQLKPSILALCDFLEHHNSTTSTGTSQGADVATAPIVLLHAFSGGGGHSVVQLADAYKEYIQAKATSHLPSELPVSALILDSVPGMPDFEAGVRVAMSSIPQKSTIARLLFTPVAYALSGWLRLAHELGWSEDFITKIRRTWNIRDGPFLYRAGRIVPRTYIYSKTDDLVDWQSVVKHAAEAKIVAQTSVKGSTSLATDVENAIRLECFDGSQHVNHVSVDQARYWRIVQETVDRAVLGSLDSVTK